LNQDVSTDLYIVFKL